MIMTNTFTQDWFGTRNEAYINTAAYRMGGENQHRLSYLYNDAQIVNMLNANEALGKELDQLLAAVGVNGVNLTITKDTDTGMTNGKMIKIGTNFSREFTNNLDKLETIFGITLHEACHCLFTNFTHINETMSSTRGQNKQVLHYIQNVLEDELIEETLIQKFPGYKNLLGQVKYSVFEASKEQLLCRTPMNDLEQILMILLYIIRYPKYMENINETVRAKYTDLFTNIKNVCKNNKIFKMDWFKNHPEDITLCSVAASKNILCLLKNFIDDEAKEKSKEDKNKENSENKSSENEGNENESQNGNSSEDNKENESSNNKTENKTTGDDTFSKQLSDMLSDTNNIIDIDDDNNMCKSSSEVNPNDSYWFDKKLNEQHSDDYNPTQQRMTSYGLTMKPSRKLNKATYNEFLHEVNKYIKDCKDILVKNDKTKNTFVKEHFQMNGTLNPNMLASAVQGVKHVYDRMATDNKKTDSKYAFVITIDESGSMGRFNNCRKKENAGTAQKLAILLYEILQQNKNIESYVYGYGDCIYNYIDKKQTNKYVLGELHSQGNQHDAATMKSVIEDVKRQTKLPIIYVNITDSIYCEDGDDIKSIIENNEDVVWTTIMVNSSYYIYSESFKENNNKIYGKGNWITMDSIKNFSEQKEKIVSMLNKIWKSVNK